MSVMGVERKLNAVQLSNKSLTGVYCGVSEGRLGKSPDTSRIKEASA